MSCYLVLTYVLLSLLLSGNFKSKKTIEQRLKNPSLAGDHEFLISGEWQRKSNLIQLKAKCNVKNNACLRHFVNEVPHLIEQLYIIKEQVCLVTEHFISHSV